MSERTASGHGMQEFDPNEFSQARVAVIGGRLGTGPATVRAFVGRGAQVTVADLAHAPAPPGCAMEGARYLPVDMTQPEAIDDFLDQAQGPSGRLDVLVLMAPPVKTAKVFDIEDAEYRRVIETELLQPIAWLRAAARRMVRQQYGRLISFCSMSGKTGVHPHVSPYAAAKGGLITFSRGLAAEIAPTGVTVNVIATALFDVQVAAMDDASEAAKGIPVGRVGRSAEAAHAALFLASRNAGYVTGETLNLSGGRFMD
ncbi:SDR family oxidoreductase [Ramlibacter sp. AW1]|uniref:SDR family oxidoreductase n=1 Tax=Ramlibacter aurantiacus TaxID=2801330 RepID=A0A936ZN10_9BURK|nr:SDR family oxidoreductase [Ramlibacter aurantiacus]MBL0420295.1 SDR family oxidoreductase [Ramlibacter aurantiacus]